MNTLDTTTLVVTASLAGAGAALIVSLLVYLARTRANVRPPTRARARNAEPAEPDPARQAYERIFDPAPAAARVTPAGAAETLQLILRVQQLDASAGDRANTMEYLARRALGQLDDYTADGVVFYEGLANRASQIN